MPVRRRNTGANSRHVSPAVSNTVMSACAGEQVPYDRHFRTPRVRPYSTKSAPPPIPFAAGCVYPPVMQESDITTALDAIDHVLATARSIRRNLDFHRPIDLDELASCIDIATQAPTGAAGENWRFVVVTDASTKASLAALYGAVLDEFSQLRGVTIKSTQRALVNRLHEIPAMVLVCATTPPPGLEIGQQVGYYGSLLPAAWSLMLALRARHIGATWTSLLSARQAEVRAILRMPEDSAHLVMLPIGYMKGARLRRADRLPAAAVTYLDSWGTMLPDGGRETGSDQ